MTNEEVLEVFIEEFNRFDREDGPLVNAEFTAETIVYLRDRVESGEVILGDFLISAAVFIKFVQSEMSKIEKEDGEADAKAN